MWQELTLTKLAKVLIHSLSSTECVCPIHLLLQSLTRISSLPPPSPARHCVILCVFDFRSLYVHTHCESDSPVSASLGIWL